MSRADAVRTGTEADAVGAARLHTSELPEGFLVTLGTPFLVRLYTRVVRFRGSFLLVMGDESDIDGFVAVAERTGDLYREFLRRDGVRAGLAAVPALARAPRRTWETLRYGTGGADLSDLPDAEILSVAVAPRARGRGVGRALVAAATDELGARGVGAVRVVTAADNEPARRMYGAAGFSPRATTEVHAGVEQVVLAWP
ncbi:MAG: GNAT family N-acetyltransferase [Acidimicrobiales bacterium]|nr:GNAT family N-acetyltransferase [Acidimicrobiales bacterium]